LGDERATEFDEGLTDQERRVARSVGRGATTKQTARELGISTKTVEYHLGNIYRKLGLHGRAELAHLVGTRAGASAPVDALLAQGRALAALDGHQSVEAFVATIIDGRTGRSAVDPSAIRNPYKGLRAFDEADALDFFGRDRLVEQILAAMSVPGDGDRVVTVVGPSGSGKSSVVHAGLVPAIRRGALEGSERWRLAPMVPGADPLAALHAALDGCGAPNVGATNGSDPADDPAVLVIVDQLEEIFTLCDDAPRAAFVTALADAVEAESSQLRVVVTLRADFLDRPLADPRLAALIGGCLVPVPPLAPDELEAAIVGPARRAGIGVEPGLAAVLAADFRDQPGVLPLVQFALTDTFDHSESGLLTIDGYRSIGGISGSVARKAENLYTSADVGEQDVARRLFTRLVSTNDAREDTGRRVPVRELTPDPELLRVLARYDSARLLTFDRDARTGAATVQLAHDALIREWPRLQHWLEADRDGRRFHHELTSRAEAWEESGHDDGELFRGARLTLTEQWAADHAADLNRTEAQFLAASVGRHRAEEAAQRRSIRRTRRGLVLLGAITVVALVAGAVAWRQQHRASSAAHAAAQERDSARAAEFAAETGRLAALVPTLARTSPALSLLLAAEAERRAPNPETWGALLQALVAADSVVGFLPSTEPLREVFYDGSGGLVGVSDTTVTTWAVDTHRPTHHTVLPVPVRPPVYVDDHQVPVAFASGTVAWVGDDERAHVLDVESGTHRTVTASEADNVALDSSAERLVVATRAGDVTMYRLPELTVAWSVGGTGPRSVKAAGEEAGIPPMPPQLDNYPTIAEVVFGPGDATVAVSRGWVVTAFDASTGSQQGTAAFPMAVTGLSIEPAAPRRLLALGAHHIAAADLPALATVASVGLDSQGIYEVDVAGLLDGRVVALDGRGQIFVLAAGSLTMPAPPPAMEQPAPTTSSVVETLQAHTPSTRAIALSPDGATAAIAGDGGASLVRVDGGGLIRRAVPRGADHVFFMGGRDAAWIGSTPLPSAEAPEVLRVIRSAPRVWRCDAIPCVERHELALDPTKEIYAEPGSDMLATFTNRSLETGTWRFFDGPTIEPKSPEITPETRLGGLAAVAPDRSWVAIANLDTSLEIFETSTGELLNRFPAATWGVDAPGVTPMPSGHELFVFSHSTGDSYVLDVRTGEHRPSPIAGKVTAVAFARSGDVIATVAPTGELGLRTGSAASVQHTLPNTNPFLGMALSDDGRFLLTVHPAGGRLWDVVTGEPIGEPIPTLTSTAPAPVPGQRTHLLTASDQWVQIWDLDVERWGELACLAAGRNLTRTEWEQVGPRDQEYRATCDQWPTG
jgi:DNA-binding CsgD family transcriptional regulator